MKMKGKATTVPRCNIQSTLNAAPGKSWCLFLKIRAGSTFTCDVRLSREGGGGGAQIASSYARVICAES